MKKKIKSMVSVLLIPFLILVGCFSLLSIKAEAKGAADAASLDGVYIFPDTMTRIIIDKAGVDLNGYDFSGYDVWIKADNVTVQNCKNISFITTESGKGIKILNNTIVGPCNNGIVINTSETTVSGNTLTGTGKDEGGQGILLSKVSNCEVSNNTITGHKGGQSILIGECTNIKVVGNTIKDSYHYGMVVKGDNGSLVQDNKIINSACDKSKLSKNNHGDGLAVNTGCKGTQIINNTVDGVGTLESHCGNGLIVADESTDILVKGNTINNSGYFGIQVTYGATKITLENNTVSKSGSDGINISRDSAADSIGNKVFESGSKYDEGGNGIVYDGHTHTDGKQYVNGSIKNNECYSNKRNGIFVQDANVTASGNNSHDNKESGIRVEGMGTSTYSNNTLSNNANHTGLHLLGTSNSTVTSNNIYKSSPDMTAIGIRLEENAVASLTNNRISNYGDSAIFVAKNAKVTMEGNQANLSGLNEFKAWTYFISESTQSDAKLHNHLYLKEITTSKVKGQTFYDGYSSGAVVDGNMYKTSSSNGGIIEMSFPAQGNTDKIVLFTVDNKNNSICLNAAPDFVLKGFATDESQVREFVNRYYKVLLGRDADEGGLNDWTAQLISKKKTGAQVAEGIVDSEEFKLKGYSDEEYIKKLYLAFFDREADESGYNDWLNKIKTTHTRKQVLAGFIGSEEYKTLCAKYGINPGELNVSQNNKPNQNNNNNNNQNKSNMLKVDATNADRAQVQAFVERLYQKILGRNGENEGIQDWTNTIMNSKDTGGTAYDAGTVISKGFFTSEEYALKNANNEQFLRDCYAAFFNREPDAAGYNDWLTKLNNNEVSRKEVIEKGFGTSEEFKLLLESYGFKVLN